MSCGFRKKALMPARHASCSSSLAENMNSLCFSARATTANAAVDDALPTRFGWGAQVREVFVPAFSIQHGRERGMMMQTEQPRGVRYAPMSVYQSPPHIPRLVGVYTLAEIEVRPKIHEAAPTSLWQGRATGGHDADRARAQT